MSELSAEVREEFRLALGRYFMGNEGGAYRVFARLIAEAERRGAERVAARVEAACALIDRHTEREPDAVEFRHGDTGVWWGVTDTIRAALKDGTP